MWLLIPILIYSVIYLYVRHIYSCWGRQGIPSERSGISFRFLKSLYQREFYYVNAIADAYSAGREGLYGIYFFFRPVLLVRDITLARDILEPNNGHFTSTKSWDLVKDYKRMNLLEKLAPMFSRECLSEMFPIADTVGDNMTRHLLQRANNADGIELDIQHLLRLYAINVIGQLIYGLDVNIFEQSDHILTKYINNSMGSQSFTLGHLHKKSSIIYRLRDLIKTVVESREDGDIIRKDLIQLLVKFRNGNELITTTNDTKWQVESAQDDDKLLSMKLTTKVAEDLLKTALDSISATSTLTLFEVLQEPLMLEKLQTEVDEQNTELNFNSLDGLKFMDMCFKETLRKYPPIPIIERICRKSYTVPNSRFTIEAGRTIMVPLMAIQRDEKHFSDPLKYKPLRFLHGQQNQQCIDDALPLAFMPYGIGGAQCIAKNFSKMIIKTALIKLLQNFHIEMDSTINNNSVEIDYRPSPFIKSKDGLKVKLKTRRIKSKFYL